MSMRQRARRLILDELSRRRIHIERLSPEEQRFRTDLVDPSTPLPSDADTRLAADHARLAALRQRYQHVDDAVRVRSRWSDERAASWLDLRYFRGDNAYVWHYRESRRLTELKFLLYALDVSARDRADLLATLGEDGAFGCWTYDLADLPTLSRDLLDSVNELLFLDAHLGVLDGSHPRVLDIGAGYGRMAHRYVGACAGVADYCCVDAVPESTFLSEYYVEHRDLAPVARVVPLDEVDQLDPGSFDLALNIHSWSECPIDAIRWWVERLEALEVPTVFVVPNEPVGFESLEPDGSRFDYRSVLEAAGYALAVDKPVIAHQAVRDALDLHDRHCLFERRR